MKSIVKRTAIRKTGHASILAPNTKVKGMKWVFHKGDDDNQPSVPHGHSEDGKYKLQLWTGDIYDVKTGKLKYKAKEKDMNKLYNYPGFLDFVNECREEYMKRNPTIKLPELPYKQYKIGYRKQQAEIKDRYEFFIEHRSVYGRYRNG